MKYGTYRPGFKSSLVLLCLILSSLAAFAHPMGNFSINHYSKIRVGQESVEILYIVDMAEIPTYQEIRQFDVAAKTDDPSTSRYLDGQGPLLRAGLLLECDGQPVSLDTMSRHAIFSEGAGGLPTLKISFVFRGKLDVTEGIHQLSFTDNNFPGRTGWKEIVVLGDQTLISNSTAPAADRSRELTNYSSDSLNSPPQQSSALVTFKTVLFEPHKASADSSNAPNTFPMSQRTSSPCPSPNAYAQHRKRGPSKHPKTLATERGNELLPARRIVAPLITPQLSGLRAQNTPRSRFTDLISTRRKLSFWVLFSAALIAAGLGALHALEPGHGKTIVAAYLVGSRGTARHAVLLGFVVTAVHTAGVFLLGAVTLYASRYIVPEQLYPWLGAISGLSVAALGVFTVVRHLTGTTGEHSHGSGNQHSHWFLSMFKQNGHGKSTQAQPNTRNRVSGPMDTEPPDRTLSLRELCMLGISGGIVPCPAALVVLLSAFSLHRIGFGMFLITAFSLGLAFVLVIVGLAMVYTKKLVAARVQRRDAMMRYLPILSSVFMVGLGLAIAASAMGSVHLAGNPISRDALIPFATVVLLGLFLGMRHSTDPDHVVAVSTIVSRQGSIRSSAAIGLLWGLGHTLTIFFVGSVIIIFGVVIPPRLGLSMEFCVALMLILLGVINLTGVMSWITDRLSPKASACRAHSKLENKSSTVSGWIRSHLERQASILGNYQIMRPLVIGLVHGLAGSAAVALLVLSTIKSPLWSTAYLLVFGLGTMAGMMIMTTAISVPVLYTGKKFSNINRHLTVVSGLASVAFGMFLVYQIGFVDGLFSTSVHWVPE